MKDKIPNNDFSIKAIMFLFKLLLLVVSAVIVISVGIITIYYASKLVVFITGNGDYYEIFTVLYISTFLIGGIASVLYAAVKFVNDKNK